MVFAYHEVKVAYGIADASNSGSLDVLVAPINKLMSVFQTKASKRGGRNEPCQVRLRAPSGWSR